MSQPLSTLQSPGRQLLVFRFGGSVDFAFTFDKGPERQELSFLQGVSLCTFWLPRSMSLVQEFQRKQL